MDSVHPHRGGGSPSREFALGDPGSPVAQALTDGRSLVDQGDFPAAIRLYRRVIREATVDSDDLGLLWGELGETYLQCGELADATDALRNALARLRTGANAARQRRRLAVAYRESGDHDRARDELAAAETELRVEPDAAEWALLLRERGALLEGQGLHSRALESYREALALHEEHGDVGETIVSLRHVASALQELGELPEAADHVQRALDLLERHAPQDLLERIELWTLLGSFAADQGKPDEALAVYSRALELADEIEYEVGQADVLRHIGAAHASKGAFDDAVAAYTQAIRLARSLDDTVSLSEMHGDLGEVYLETGRVSGAVEEFNKALAYDHAHQDILGMAIQHRRLGAAYRELGEFDRARDDLDLADQLLRQVDDDGERSLLLVHRGSLSAATGQYEDALACFRESLRINEQRDDLVGKMTCLRHIAAVEVELGEFDDAYQRLSEARQLIDAHDGQDRPELVEVTNLLADVHAAQGRYAAAMEALDESARVAEEIALPPAIADTWCRIAIVAGELGDTERAQQSFGKAFDVYSELGDDVGLSVTLASRAEFHEACGEIELAMRYFRKGLRIARRRHLPPAITRLSLGLARCCRRTHDLRGVAEHLEEIEEVIDVPRSPLRGEIWIELGQLAELDERYDEALELYDAARTFFEDKGKPNSARSCSRLIASVRLRQGDVENALSDTLEALPPDADRPWEAMVNRLHPSISDAAGALFAAREYEAALQMAFRTCEEALNRRAGKHPREDLAQLIDRWFTPEQRGLAPWVDAAEVRGFGQFWRSAFLARRNPQAHRALPVEAQDAFSWLCVTHLMITLLDAV